MAESILFNIMETLIEKLSSMVVESWNMRDDLEKLVDNMAEIKAVILDAEEQQGTNHQVQLWLEKLKDTLYDAEDLLDDFSTEDKRRRVMTKDKQFKVVRIFFSSSNQLVFSFKMSQKIKELRKRIEALNVDNDKAVQQHFFELKKWVCVSDDFDVKAIAGEIIGSRSDDVMEQVQQELRKRVEGKRYLLVLDDIWNENRAHWLKLMTLLVDGAKGSKIIITTRSEKVAKISGTSSFFFLKGLDEEQSWKLFSQLAFENGKEPENQNLVSIGKEIVRKCSGVPLAIRSIGSLMYSMETENDWLSFKDKDLAKIDEQGENVVLQLLKVSYDHLPFHLKKCFSFCSLFPKDYHIWRRNLIQLWVAQGFIQSSDDNMCLEEVGNGYFMNLAHRCFFQDFQRNLDDEVNTFKMHDLVHDLAKFVSGNDCAIVNEKEQHIDKQTRHLSFSFSLDSFWQVPSSLFKAYKLRTFLLPSQKHVRRQLSLEDLNLSSFEQLRLRVLDLNHLNSRMIPSCIGKFKHLRYLNLSGDEELLKGCFHQFKNSLKYLGLLCCPNLISIPQHKDILCLRLRHVSEKILLQAVDNSDVDDLRINKINDLKSLTGVIPHLTKLRELHIEKCQELDLCNDEDGCYSMQWKQLQNLKQLKLCSMSKMESLPEGLQHVTTLQRLEIDDCANLAYIPEWVTSLQAFKVTNCQNLTSLPQRMHN